VDRLGKAVEWAPFSESFQSPPARAAPRALAADCAPCSEDLAPFQASEVALDTSIEAALEPVKLCEDICEGGCGISSRFAIQPLCLDQPGASSRILEGASKVANGLGVVVRVLPTGAITACHRQPSESDVVHDHIRLRQHNIVAIARIAVRTWYVKHTGTTQGGETVGGSSGSRQLSPGGGSTEMISDGR